MFWWVRWSNYNQKKKYSRLAISWNVWGFNELGLFCSDGSSIKLWQKKGTVVWSLVAMFGGSVSLDCFGGFVAMFFGRLLDQITNYDRKKGTVIWPLVGMSTTYFWLILNGVVSPASSLLSKSIRKASITATCRLEWHYQLSKKNMAFSSSNIEIQWFFFQVDT